MAQHGSPSDIFDDIKNLGANCQLNEAVTEWELDSHLAEGWKYIATLPSGRVIVEN